MLDEIRMRTACFARAPQGCTSRLSKFFLLTFHEVTPLSKTRNQLLVSVYIRQRETARLVAVIELLSPVNKRRGKGREAYLDKRRTFLTSPVHVIEIDLLRRYPRMPFDDPLPPAHYLVMVCKAGERPRSSVWPINVRQPLPTIPIPLLAPDPPVPLELGQALHTAYERARYDLRVDYRRPPVPPLSPADAAWTEALLASPEGRSPQDAP